ncbi:MAG: hypothetical protein V8R80_05955 [Eubacterium sp.]
MFDFLCPVSGLFGCGEILFYLQETSLAQEMLSEQETEKTAVTEYFCLYLWLGKKSRGVYELPSSRIYQLVEKAGGMKKRMPEL